MQNIVFKLPDLGEGVVEAEIVAWHVSPGEEVRVDQPLLDVMTDKATVTIPSGFGRAHRANIHGERWRNGRRGRGIGELRHFGAVGESRRAPEREIVIQNWRVGLFAVFNVVERDAAAGADKR